MNEDKILTCSNCGRGYLVIKEGMVRSCYGGKHFYVECSTCNVRGPWQRTRQGAIYGWNKRFRDLSMYWT
jgi:hypothetical protein